MFQESYIGATIQLLVAFLIFFPVSSAAFHGDCFTAFIKLFPDTEYAGGGGLCSSSVTLKGDYRPEYELKLYLRGSSIQNSPANYLARNVETLAGHALERYYFGRFLDKGSVLDLKRQNPELRLTQEKFAFFPRPLKSRLEFYHGGVLLSAQEEGSKISTEEFVPSFSQIHRIYTFPKKPGILQNSIEMDYLVAHPLELSQYHDSAEGKLDSLGLALRVKEWRGLGTAREDREVMVKQVKGHEGPFLHRREYRRTLDSKASPETIAAGIRSFVTELFAGEPPFDTDAELKPGNRITTDRIAVPLMYESSGNPQTVGFVSFDAFRPADQDIIGVNDILHPTRAFFEIEIEVFPEFKHLITHPDARKELGRFVNDLMQTFDAGPTDIHKHQVHSNEQMLGSIRGTLEPCLRRTRKNL